MNLTSCRVAFLAYLLLFFTITFRYWGQGKVIAPYRQFAELGLSEKSGPVQLENRIQ